ncbi:MAG TPA: O-antigen ligase family protein [Chitinophagales bacterium]|nr:O-antigen ligase family protein [Chitinophagales bacterium]
MKRSASKSIGKSSEGLKELLHRLFIREKLNNTFGYIFLLTCALLFSVALGTQEKESALALVALIIGVPVLFAVLFNLQFGIVLTLTAAFFVLWFKKFLPEALPLGVTIDILIGVMLFGMFIRQISIRDWSFIKNPVSVIVLIWIAYNVLMVANPAAQSRAAWSVSVRAMAGVTLLYYIAVFAIDNLRTIETIVKICIGLSLLAALYGLFQEFAGLPSFEMNWLKSDPRLFKLVYQWGKIRIFSFLSDPSTFGILMGYMGIFCIVLAAGPFAAIKRVALFSCGAIMLFAMAFTGTRTAFVLLPAGLVFFAILTLQRHIIAGLVFFLMAGGLFVMMPTSNTTIYRIQSAFKPQKDASMNTRLTNQEKIQPFIRSHPIGGGLGSTGSVGRRFTPDTMLAKFPPDSGFVRVAVELGWVGLLLYCSMLFVILRTGIRNYVRVYSPKLRAYYVAFLVMVFAMILSNYPQESLVQLPTSVIFYISLAALVKMKDFDKSAGGGKKDYQPGSVTWA